MSAQHARQGDEPVKRPLVPRLVRVLSVPIIIGWILVAVLLNVFVPSLNDMTTKHSGPMIPISAPSQFAMQHTGKAFEQPIDTATAMVVLESQGRKLGEADHQYYDELLAKLRADTTHIHYIMDFWGKSVTAASAQSPDGECAFVSVTLGGDVGQSLANESTIALRDIVAKSPPPAGLKVYVGGAAPLMTDLLKSGNESMDKIMLLTIVIIVVMLLLVYRSVFSMLLTLFTVIVELLSGMGIVAFLVDAGLIGTSSFASGMIPTLVLGAGTDYGIFLLGRYHEARQAGQDKETAFYTAYQGVVHVILGSGLTIAGATYCMSFARLDYFKTMGPACAVAMLVSVAAGITLGPALLAVGSRFGLFDQKRKIKTRGWRRVGTNVVRWPVPVLAASCAVVLLGAVFLPTYKVNYDDRSLQPAGTPANAGFLAADRHFTKGKLSSDTVVVETDHDMRNPADFISLETVAKDIYHIKGIESVQSITRPQGRPMEHTSLGYMLGSSSTGQGQQLPFTEAGNEASDMRLAMNKTMNTVAYQLAKITAKQTALNKLSAESTNNDMIPLLKEMNTDIGTLDDFIRPMRAYFYWETNCYELPWCWTGRSLFDMLDSIDKMGDSMTTTAAITDEVNALAPKLAALTKITNDMTAALNAVQDEDHGRSQLSADQTKRNLEDNLDMGSDFDNSRNDSTFYMPKSIFTNPDFKLGLELMVSPDGKAAKFTITHEGVAMSAEGIKHIEAVADVARESVKGTSLSKAKIYLSGAASQDKDIKSYIQSDLLIAAIATFALIFLIMMVITGSLGAALTILFTVAFSYAGALGWSTFIWEHVIGLDMHWMVLPISFILLVAVGSDYNLLLIARLKEEIHGGLNTGLIRALGSTGGVVTSAGMVFAITMLAMVPNDLKAMAQVGSTICIGLLLDTLIVRSFIVPAIARLLGPWFWWPRVVRRRPIPARRS